MKISRYFGYASVTSVFLLSLNTWAFDLFPSNKFDIYREPLKKLLLPAVEKNLLENLTGPNSVEFLKSVKYFATDELDVIFFESSNQTREIRVREKIDLFYRWGYGISLNILSSIDLSSTDFQIISVTMADGKKRFVLVHSPTAKSVLDAAKLSDKQITLNELNRHYAIIPDRLIVQLFREIFPIAYARANSKLITQQAAEIYSQLK